MQRGPGPSYTRVVTASLPAEVQAVFDRFITTELTTIDGLGQPITWPVTPYYTPGAPCIDVTTGLGYPKKARDAQANPLVSLLFSDPTGSELPQAPMVLVQGWAEVDVRAEETERRVRIDAELTGVPLQPGLACLTAHVHAAEFTWQENFQVRGDLVFADDAWVLVPRRLIGGFEVPRSRIAMLRANAAKARRFRRTAKRELARHG
jgi:hypothetical protein